LILLPGFLWGGKREETEKREEQRGAATGLFPVGACSFLLLSLLFFLRVLLSAAFSSFLYDIQLVLYYAGGNRERERERGKR